MANEAGFAVDQVATDNQTCQMTATQLVFQAGAILNRAQYGNASDEELVLARRWLEQALKTMPRTLRPWIDFQAMWEMVEEFGLSTQSEMPEVLHARIWWR